MMLLEAFEKLEEPRDKRGKKYKLSDLMVMTVYGILCGFTDFVNIADYLKVNEKYFTELLDLKYGTPSHDCLSDIFAKINPQKFMELFVEWLETIVDDRIGSKISIDGKAVKSATDKINGGNTPYIVSAFIGSSGISLGQVKVDDKSNEITAIPELLELIDIKGSIITIDAIGTQEEIANKIVKKEAHYILDVKKNQKNLLKNIKQQFKKYNNLEGHKEVYTKRTLEKDHGRIEERKYYLTYNVDSIKDKEKWKTVKCVAYVRIEKIMNDETIITEKYYICDYEISIDEFEETVRDHWNIETGLHWKLDVIFREDDSRSRIGNSIHNLSLVRKIAFNLTNLDDSFKPKTPLRRKITRYLFDFSRIERLLFEVIPNVNRN